MNTRLRKIIIIISALLLPFLAAAQEGVLVKLAKNGADAAMKTAAEAALPAAVNIIKQESAASVFNDYNAVLTKGYAPKAQGTDAGEVTKDKVIAAVRNSTVLKTQPRRTAKTNDEKLLEELETAYAESRRGGYKPYKPIGTLKTEKYTIEQNERKKLDALLSPKPHYQNWPYARWTGEDGAVDVDMGHALVAKSTMPFRFLMTDALHSCIGLVITAKYNETVLYTGLAHVTTPGNFNFLLKEGFLTKMTGSAPKANKFEISMTSSASNMDFAIRILREITKYAEKENITVTVASDLFRSPAVAVDIKTGSLYVNIEKIPFYLRDDLLKNNAPETSGGTMFSPVKDK